MNTKHRLSKTIPLVLAICIAACSPAKEASPPQAAAADKMAPRSEPMARHQEQKLSFAERTAPAAEMEAAAPAPGSQDAAALNTLAEQQPDRYLIKNASVSLEVDDARVASDALVKAVQGVGGYVGQLNEQLNAFGARSISMQVRVPAERFDESMRQFDAMGKILNIQITTDDVTEEFVDTDSRVRNLKKTEERVLDHLNRTAKLEDILMVEQELSRYRERIEQMEGRLRFLQNRVAFSTIQITIQEKAKGEPVTPPQSFSTAKVFSEATRSLVKFALALWVRVIWMAVWAPVWIPITAAAFFILRSLVRRNRELTKPRE